MNNATPDQQAAVLQGLAREFDATQEIDSNTPGFVVRIRGLQLRAAEVVLQALTMRRLEGQTWTDRLWWLAKHHAEFAETLEPPDVRRIVLMRNLWLEVCGFNIADGRRTPDGVEILRIKGEPLFPTPFDCREIAVQALRPESKEFAREAARQARLRSAFICNTIADVLPPVEQVEQPKIILVKDQAIHDVHAAAPAAAELDWSNYRTPSEWRRLRKDVGLSDSESTWRNLRNDPATANAIQGEPGNEKRMVRLTRDLVELWGLELTEFQQATSK